MEEWDFLPEATDRHAAPCWNSWHFSGSALGYSDPPDPTDICFVGDQVLLSFCQVKVVIVLEELGQCIEIGYLKLDVFFLVSYIVFCVFKELSQKFVCAALSYYFFFSFIFRTF